MNKKFRKSDFKCDDQARRMGRIILNGLNTDLGKAVSNMPDADLVKLELDPNEYTDPETFQKDWLAVNLLSKYPSLNLGIDTESVAYGKFVDAEKACAETNIRLLTPSHIRDVEAVIHTARRKILKLLGRFSWDSCLPYFGFSGGASTRLKRRDAQPPNKFSFVRKPHVTKACLPLALAYLKHAEGGPYGEYFRSLGFTGSDAFQIVDGNKLTTVPKNAKTDRVIAIEPDWNMFIQRGIGGLLRRKLKRVGVDLDTQAKNQDLAKAGSITGALATVDLSAASDSVSMGICELLLPHDWYDALKRTRSPSGVLPDGSVVHYQKVSSMGNGFTFELESLIFWALTSGSQDLCENVFDRRIAIYGDDIIVDRDVVPLLEQVFTYCGFSFNKEKSFWAGPFRESCGKHYFQGCDVTPFYIRKPVTNVYRQFWLCNSLRRWSFRLFGVSDLQYFGVWKRLVTTIPKRYRHLSVPDGAGDGGLLRSLVEAKPSFAGYRYTTPVITPRTTSSKVAEHLGYFDTLFNGQSEKSPLRWNGVMWVPDKYLRNSYTITASGKLRSQQETAIELLTVDPDEYRIRRYSSVGWDDPPPWVDLDGDL